MRSIEGARRLAPHLHGAPIAPKYVAAAGLSAPIQTAQVDFFQDPLPQADVITMGMILHDWNLEKKMHLIRVAYDALPPGGALVAIESIIDDAFDHSAADSRGWFTGIGFQRFDVIHLAGPWSAVVACK